MTFAVDPRPLADVVPEVAEVRGVAALISHIRGAILYAVPRGARLEQLAPTFLDDRIVDDAIKPVSIETVLDFAGDRLVLQVCPPRWRRPAVLEISRDVLERA